MINKQLEKKIELELDSKTSGSDNSIELEYYLLESEIKDYNELSGKKAYGVEIVKKFNSSNIECEAIKNLSCCRENAKKILDKLINNSVTPIELTFILDDIIGI